MVHANKGIATTHVRVVMVVMASNLVRSLSLMYQLYIIGGDGSMRGAQLVFEAVREKVQLHFRSICHAKSRERKRDCERGRVPVRERVVQD